MTTNNNYSKEDIEARLQSGVRDELSAAELSEMKTSLMAYAAYHSPSSVPVVKATASFFWQRVAAGTFVVLLVAVGGTGVVASQSLPGDSLYALKVNIVEPTIATLDTTDITELQTQALFLERRLLEVKQLEEAGRLDDEAGAVVAAYVTESVRSVESVLDASAADDEVISVATLQIIDQMQAVVEAQEIILEDAAVIVSSEVLADVGDALDAAQTEAVAALVADGATSTVASYISDSLDSIEEKIATNEYASTTVEMVESYIDEAYVEIAEEDIAETHENIAEANQRLLTEEYLSEEVVIE